MSQKTVKLPKSAVNFEPDLSIKVRKQIQKQQPVLNSDKKNALVPENYLFLSNTRKSLQETSLTFIVPIKYRP